MNANLSKKVIEMSKSEAKKAGIPNSDEFNALNVLRAAYPTFRIEIKKSKSRDTMKGLTINYMKKYIEEHDADGSVKDEFALLREQMTPYGQMKVWFLEKFPEVTEKADKAAEIIELAKAKRAARLTAQAAS